MSESWKNRLWSLLLVCTFAVVLSVCNKAMDSSKKSSSGIAYADFKPSDVSHIMTCTDLNYMMNYNSKLYYNNCDASNDDSSITSSMTLKNTGGNDQTYYFVISLDTLASNGWRPCGTSNAHRQFCK